MGQVAHRPSLGGRAVPWPWEERHGQSIAWHGMASVNKTRPHCVNQMGKAHSKPLAARHGRGTACYVWNGLYSTASVSQPFRYPLLTVFPFKALFMQPLLSPTVSWMYVDGLNWRWTVPNCPQTTPANAHSVVPATFGNKKLCMTAMLLFYILISRRTFYSSNIYRSSFEGFP